MTTKEEIMRELHDIREQFYEETKHMTPEERLEHERRDLDEQVAKLGITLRRPDKKTYEPATW
jgi:hypothetical protein